ncbi:MAG: DNA gyrase inhibitor YacG [Planctomycetaceae bacterium]
MIRGRCPTCARPFEVATIDDLPTFPFCSDRCRLIDLGRWIDGSYTIPDPQAPPEPSRPGGGEEGA